MPGGEYFVCPEKLLVFKHVKGSEVNFEVVGPENFESGSDAVQLPEADVEHSVVLGLGEQLKPQPWVDFSVVSAVEQHGIGDGLAA